AVAPSRSAQTVPSAHSTKRRASRLKRDATVRRCSLPGMPYRRAAGMPWTRWGRGSALERQPDVVLRDGGRRGGGVHEVVELGHLHLVAECAGLGELVHQRREPPRETLGLPDAAQAALGIGVDAAIVAGVVLRQRSRQVTDVA